MSPSVDVFEYLDTLAEAAVAFVGQVGLSGAHGPAAYHARFAATAVIIASQLAHATGIGLATSEGWYALGVSWLLVLAAFAFTAALTSARDDAPEAL